jgi:hypothetical protein
LRAIAAALVEEAGTVVPGVETDDMVTGARQDRPED